VLLKLIHSNVEFKFFSRTWLQGQGTGRKGDWRGRGRGREGMERRMVIVC